MGYSTEFRGELKFDKELSGSQIAELDKYLGEDVRDLKDIDEYEGDDDFTFIDLELTKDYSGIQWNNSEKSYDMEGQINFITFIIRRKYPDFKLTGKMLAQGEEIEDRYEIVMKDGVAVRKNIIIKGERITCPHCEEEFILEE